MATKIKPKPEPERICVLYKGDEFIADGTPIEIARKTGKSYDHIMFMTRPAYVKRFVSDKKYKTKGRLEMVELEDE